MAKPKAIQWLEGETGQIIPYSPEESIPRERHLSVRVRDALAAALEELAAERKVTVSQLVRDLVEGAVAQGRAMASMDARGLVDRLAADVAEVRRRLAG